MVPEQPVIIERICAVQISSNLQFFTKVLKFGTLFLFQSLVRRTFLVLRRKCKSFPGSPRFLAITAVNKFFLYYVNKANKKYDDEVGSFRIQSKRLSLEWSLPFPTEPLEFGVTLKGGNVV